MAERYTTHRCAAWGCLCFVVRAHLFCADHWRLVGEEASAQIPDLYAAWSATGTAEAMGALSGAVTVARIDILAAELGTCGLDAPGWARAALPWRLAEATAHKAVASHLRLDRSPERGSYLATPGDAGLCRAWLRRVQLALRERGQA